MGNLSINNGGVATNKGSMPSIDLRYGPYASVHAAHTALSDDDVVTVGLTVGIIDGSNIVEYWYQGGTSEANLVPKHQSSGSSFSGSYNDLNNKPKIKQAGSSTEETLQGTLEVSAETAPGDNAGVTLDTQESGKIKMKFTLPKGADGQNGATPAINQSNKHWMIGESDTGIIAEGQNGAPGNNGHNPCLGRFSSVPSTFAETPRAGDYYFVDTVTDATTIPPTIETKIYKHDGSAWDGGSVVDVSNLSFLSGQSVAGTAIKDLNGEKDQTADGVLSVDAGMALKEDLYGIDTEVEGDELIGAAIITTEASGTYKSWLMDPTAAAGGNVIVAGNSANANTLYMNPTELANIKARGVNKLRVTARTGQYKDVYILFTKAYPSNSTYTFEDLVTAGNILCEGTTQDNMFIKVPQGETKDIAIPSDATRCCFAKFTNGSTYTKTPTSVKPLEISHRNGRLDNMTIEIVDNCETDDATKVLSAKQGKVLNEKIDNRVLIVRETTDILRSYNMIDWSKITQGVYVNNQGNLVTIPSSYRSGQCVTDFIPVETDKKYYIYGAGYYVDAGQIRGAVYNSNKEFVRVISNSTSNFDYTAVDGEAYIRVMMAKDNTATGNLNVIITLNNDGSQPYGMTTSYTTSRFPYFENKIKIIELDGKLSVDENIPELKPFVSHLGTTGLIRKYDSVAADDTVNINTGSNKYFPKYIKTCYTLSFKAFLDEPLATADKKLQIGVNADNAATFKRSIIIDKDKISLWNVGSNSAIVSANHSLTIEDFIICEVDFDYFDVKVRLVSKDGAFVKEWKVGTDIPDSATYQEFQGTAFLSSGVGLTNVTLTQHSDKLLQPIWIVGDSYMSMYAKRWPFQLIKTFGIENILVAGFAGAKSSDMYPDLQRMLNYSTPKYLLWCLGMNDPEIDYIEYVHRVERLCRNRGITLILQTIPQRDVAIDPVSPQRSADRSYINAYVRECGLRYIDAFNAICLDNGEWREGMHNLDDPNDHDHPSVLGAKVIAGQILIDFPEIANIR